MQLQAVDIISLLPIAGRATVAQYIPEFGIGDLSCFTMLPSERLELGIYKHIHKLEPGSVTTSLSILSQATGEKDYAKITERLKALEAENRILLSKYSGGSAWPRSDSPDRTFFYTDSFLVEIAPQGRKYFEELEQRAEHDAKEPMVFISCGQYSPNEIKLGKELAAKVNELTWLQGYFAENRNTLAALTNDIFRALDQCAALVAVMHHRGEVETLNDKKHIRGSIWIEQEIAIAAFLTETRKREIPVLLYIQKGIKREGVREQLKLSPFEFVEESEVVADFVSRLKNGTFLAGIPRMK